MKMLTSFRILSLAWFAVSVLGQDCRDESDCSDEVKQIFEFRMHQKYNR